MKIFVLIIILFLQLPLCAQQLQGRVSDGETGQPIEGATIRVLQGGKTVDYALADRQGAYALPWRYQDTLEVRVSLLGYRPVVLRVCQAGRQDFILMPATIQLREVEISSSRIYARKDTLRFDLSRFATDRDQYLRDVLRRLPGIEVSDNGTISYQGKPIDHFLVEGMDLSGGRYNQLNNTLSAKAVKAAEIMENYQSVKALRGKLPTNQVALNLKLDPQMRDHWMAGATLGGGWKSAEEGHGESPLFATGLHAWQLGRARQTLYNYKGNNSGHSLGDEQRMLTGQEWTAPTGHLLTQEAFSSPLALSRTLLNNTHTFNLNRLRKYPGDRLLRLQAGYTHHEQRQQRSSTTCYYQTQDTLRIEESYRHRLRSDAAFLEMLYEDNSERHLLRHRFRLDGERSQGTLDRQQQQLRTDRLTAAHQMEWLRQRGAHTWQVSSLLQGSYLPASLQVADLRAAYRQHHLLARVEGSYLHKSGLWSRSITLSLRGEQRRFLQPADERLGLWSVRLTPHLQRERGAWLAKLTLPVTLQHLGPRHENHLLYNANLFLRYRPDQHWQGWVFGSLRRLGPDLLSLYGSAYRSDYRTWYVRADVTPLTRSRQLQLYGEYKDAIREFFVTASFVYEQRRHNTLYGQYVTTDTTRYALVAHTNRGESYNLRCTLSKGLYDWYLKGTLEVALSRSLGAWLSSSAFTSMLLQHYRSDRLSVKPGLQWTPIPALELNYGAAVEYGGTRLSGGGRMSPLLQLAQSFSCSLRGGRFEWGISGEHYRNELQPGQYLSTTLLNTSLTYRHRSLRLELSLRNLFDQKEYGYTLYSATHAYTSRLAIRPRELLLTADFRL